MSRPGRASVDLLVVGAGPAGLATALYAARAGLAVTVVEQRAGPVDKACGEGLMPGAVRALDELGVPLQGHAFRGIRYVEGGRTAEARFRRGNGMGVRRTVLQSALQERASDAGVTLVRGRVGEVVQDAESVTAAGVTARYLVAADGLHSPIRAQLGLGRQDLPGPKDGSGPKYGSGPQDPAGSADRDDQADRAGGRERRYGLRRHYAVAPWTDLVEVHWAAGAEAYVTPVADDLVGVALLTSDRAPYDQQLAAFPTLAARLRGASGEAGGDPGGVRGAGPLRQRVGGRVAGRVLLVGDAAGYVDALTGEGIAVALACARAAVGAVVAGTPDRYEREWRAASRRYRVLTESLLWARSRPRLARCIVPAAARLPLAFGAVVDQLAR